MLKAKNTLGYRDGYKHQVHPHDYIVQVPIYPEIDFDTKYVKMTADGELIIKVGFAWDGASGPTWDFPKKQKINLKSL